MKIAAEGKPLTRRGLLSTLSSVYGPFGLAAPFILEGRIIIQKLCKENSAWDEPILRRSKHQWNIWKEKFRNLEKMKGYDVSNQEGSQKSRMQVFTIFQMHQKPDMGKQAICN